MHPGKLLPVLLFSILLQFTYAQIPDLQFISGATYLRGCTPGQQPCSGPAPQPVQLRDFAIGQFELTQAQYQAVTGNNPSANATCPDCPVEQVSWYDALHFCNLLSLQQGYRPAYYQDAGLSLPYQGSGPEVYWDTEADGYRLPTEAEWEYAARSSGEDFRYAGSDQWAEVAHSGSSSSAVGQRQPNALELYDMSGNVGEWCWDRQGAYPAFASCDPRGPATGNTRIYRGGAFVNTNGLSVAARNAAVPSAALPTVGLRLARTASRMLRIEGGTFTMGCTPEQGGNCQNDEFPPHTVTVDDFLLAPYELTQSEWAELVPEYTPLYNRGEGADYPTYRVSWYDAATYCNRRSLAEGLEPAYYFDEAYTQVFDSLVNDQLAYVPIFWKPDADGYRFPTEAEWEYAARGGQASGGFRYAGSDNLDEVAWHDGNTDSSTQPVGQKAPNELGLYDMTGNIYEWCWDWYDSNYYDSSPVDNPKGPDSGTLVCIRGGSWISSEDGSRLANRLNFLPGARRTTFAFRLAQSIND